MSQEFFGTDGHRAAVGEGLITPEGGFCAGLAVGAAALEDGRSLVPMGWDTRESSYWLQSAIASGVMASGAYVMRLGVIPTPGLAYATGRLEMAAYGIMATASHNPYTDNGIKVLGADGGKLSEATQAAINGRIFNTLPTRGELGHQLDGAHMVAHYEDFLVNNGAMAGAEPGTEFDGLRIVIDTANGAASGIARRVFERLGASVVPIFDQPDGKNINERCGATDTAAMRQMVTESNSDAGIALDGDADRLLMSDHHGRELTGDHLLFTLAATAAQPHEGVVSTVMSNQGLENSLADLGVKLQRTNVGDRFVAQGLRESGWRLGGEQSGHIVLPEYLCTGDGMLAAIHTIKQVLQSDHSLAAWRDKVRLFPQRLVNIPVADKSLLHSEPVQQIIARHNALLGGNGRLLVRGSGTEKKIRVMVEADDAETRASEVAEELALAFA